MDLPLIINRNNIFRSGHNKNAVFLLFISLAKQIPNCFFFSNRSKIFFVMHIRHSPYCLCDLFYLICAFFLQVLAVSIWIIVSARSEKYEIDNRCRYCENGMGKKMKTYNAIAESEIIKISLFSTKSNNTS